MSVAKREVSVLSDFRHPNIIRLLAYSIPPARADIPRLPICLVYELGANGGLNTNLRIDARASFLMWPVRLRIALEVSSALNYLHCRVQGRPAYHRDVKSANIVLTESLEAKLIDCGLAKYIPDDGDPHSMTKTGEELMNHIMRQGFIMAFGSNFYFVQVKYSVLGDTFAIHMSIQEIMMPKQKFIHSVSSYWSC